MAKVSTTSYPAGFAALELCDVDLDIGFDGEPSPVHHHFTENMLICKASSEHPAFNAPYLAAQMTEGTMVILFVKASARPVELVTLVINPRQRAALAVCHSTTEGRAARHAITILRGAVDSRFSFADLTSFPLRQPPVRTMLLAPGVGGAGVHPSDSCDLPLAHEAVFNSHGHLSTWQTFTDAGRTGIPTGATGRLLSTGLGGAVLPWMAGNAAGTLVLDRIHNTFWGVRTCEALTSDRAPHPTYGRITRWID